ELSAKLSHTFEQPHQNLKVLRSITSLFEQARQMKSTYEISAAFTIQSDFTESLHRLLTLDLVLPSADERKSLIELLSNIESQLARYKKSAIKIGAQHDD